MATAALLVAALTVVGACSEQGAFEVRTPTTPAPPSPTGTSTPDVIGPAPANVSGQSVWSPIDVSGDWEWRREEKFTIPDEFAFVFGFEPEGPITHFDCDVEGVMTLVQTGTALAGTEEETWSRCETRGGQVFPQPGLGVLIPIPEGRVQGRTIELQVGDAEVICPIHATVTRLEGEVAQALRGTGRCWVPGHPKSNPPEGSPFDLGPPPAGTEKIVLWEAFRPAG